MSSTFSGLARNLCPPGVDEEAAEVVVTPVNARPRPRPVATNGYAKPKARPQAKSKPQSKDIMLREGPINFTVNGEPVTLDTTEVSTQTSLARFLRNTLGLTGTKIMCGQAGCGACVVTATYIDPATAQLKTRSINSCITPVLKCAGWDITTVEGVGNVKDGLSAVQQRLEQFHGTQCGYCTPGMVMVMEGLLANNPNPTLEEIEEVIDGNLCRCTGYRPIFSAFHSFSSQAPANVKAKLADIEDLVKEKCGIKVGETCPTTNKPCAGACKLGPNEMSYVRSTDGEWMKPNNLEELMALLDDVQSGQKYRLVAGNTGTGIYNDGPYDMYIDIGAVPELTSINTDPFVIGGAVPLGEIITTLDQMASQSAFYSYAERMANHIRKVANTNVRNIGSIAGNLMLKHTHQDFPSDIFLLLEALNADVAIRSTNGSVQTVKPEQFLATEMDKKIIFYVLMPQYGDNYKFWSYKITPRSQNAHAYVNGAFLAEMNSPTGTTIVSRPRLCVGGLGELMVHAVNTEAYLEGKDLMAAGVLEGALSAMESDLQASTADEGDPVLSSYAYRKYLAKALLYKFLIHALGDNASADLRSGAYQIERGVSTSVQDVSAAVNPDMFPITQEIPKVEGRIQCTGEAEYADDVANYPRQVYAAHVLTSKGNCDIGEIRWADAEVMDGYVDYVSAEDIDGINDVYGTLNAAVLGKPEEIFATTRSYYAGQAVGLILADTFEHARAAAKAVTITYTNDNEPPTTNLPDARKKKNKGKPVQRVNHCKRVINKKLATKINGPLPRQATIVDGTLGIGSQYHFHMETQTCIAWPSEDGEFELRSSCQGMGFVQNVVASALNIPKNKINVVTRRIGGAYGGKITKPGGVAAACAVAAKKANRPVRLVMDLETNMKMVGKRAPYLWTYEAIADAATNKLDTFNLSVLSDGGFTGAEGDIGFIPAFVQNCYKVNIAVDPLVVLTDTPTTTACRSPVSIQCHAVSETMMEQLALELGYEDPLEFRINNLLSEGDTTVDMGEGQTYQGTNPLIAMIQQLKTDCNYDGRRSEVAAFNSANMWKKRGFIMLPMRWRHAYSVTQHYACQIAIFAGDGSVAVTLGGMEMGQGLNTKVAQVVAYELGITDATLVKIKAANNFVANNSAITGGSFGSEVTCSSAQSAAADLLTKMNEAVPNPDGTFGWVEWVKRCNLAGCDLTGRHVSNPIVELEDYDLHAVVATEVELDVLTGEKNIRRVDLLQDVGDSTSPWIDMGQIEGAFMMGVGLWTSEELKYDPVTGKLLTFDTWEYKPPASQDIPEAFNVKFYNSGTNPNGFLGSKATGEPSCLMAVSVFIALRKALDEVRTTPGWYDMDGPATHEHLQGYTEVTEADFFVA